MTQPHSGEPVPAAQAARPWRRWLVALAAIVAVGVTASMGRWQLSRAAQKQALQDAITQRQSLPALDAMSLHALPRALDAQHQRVRLRGQWLAQYTVYLDNRPQGGRPGFHVLTPLALDLSGAPATAGGHRVILVQRGWAQRDLRDPQALPPVQTPSGLVEIEGRVAAPPSRLFELDSASAALRRGEGSSPLRQNLHLPAYANEIGVALADAIVLQTGAASEGLARDWPVPGSGIDKHYGYAFQWFGLSALMAVLYVWFQFIAPRRRARAG